MKKVLWICLVLIVIGGVGAGVWFMRQSPASEQMVSEDSSTTDVSLLKLSEAYSKFDSIAYLKDYQTTTAAMTQLETGTNVIFFAPIKTSADSLLKDSALNIEKFLPYHIVVSETPITVTEGTRLKTLDGMELNVIKKDNNLYIRDAKGNDVRLRKPFQAINGTLYIIDSVLLTQ